MHRWWAALVNACFPPTCPLCDAVHAPSLVAPVCPACAAATQWLAHPLATAHVPAPAWGSVRAACRFDGPAMEAIHRLKYQRRADLAPALGRTMTERAFATSPHDVVLPVPLAAARIRQRGYNQAQLLAAPAARALRAPLDRWVLRRVRATPPQVTLSAAARQANVRGAFAVDPRRRAIVAGKRCLLIDDVMTTGATLNACARALRRAGAAQVHAVVFAAAT